MTSFKMANILIVFTTLHETLAIQWQHMICRKALIYCSYKTGVYSIYVKQVTKLEFFALLTTLMKQVDMTSMQLLIPALLKVMRNLSERSFVRPAASPPSQADVEGLKLYSNGKLIKIIPNNGSSGASTALMCSGTPTRPSCTNGEDEGSIKFFNNGVLVETISKSESSRPCPMSSAPPQMPSSTTVEDEESIKFFKDGVLIEIGPRGGSGRASTCSGKSTESQKG